MKEIELTQGQAAIVDDEDYEYLSQWKWFAAFDPSTKTYRAVRTDSKIKKTILMHRVVMRVSDPSFFVDHKNHNTLDNTKENLRVCSNSENIANSRIAKNNTTGYKGISFKKGKYEVRIIKNGKYYYLGRFQNLMEAASIYDKKAKELFGEFAKLNFPEEV